MVNRKNRVVFAAGCLAVIFASCNAYLDVKPKDRYLETHVFADSAAMELARKGIYEQLAADALYGGVLTMGAVDVMGQRYRCEEGHVMHGFGQYAYSDAHVVATFSQTWKTAYNTLLNINSFITGVKHSTGVLTDETKRQYLGEAYGLRAYLHFDLLRLFGPVYRESPDGISIPYHVVPSAQVQPLLSAKEVGARVLADLDSAYGYLSVNSIASWETPGQLADRFNYFAALATYARVCLYLGDKGGAAYFANRAIEESKGMFNWATDGLFTTEVILRIPVADLVMQYDRYFRPAQSPSLLLAPSAAVLAETYGGNIQDLRYRMNWSYYPRDGLRVDAFVKYAPPASFVPLIRISELYFILAECADSDEQGMAYLQVVAGHREEALAANTPVEEALPRVYRREFWGEGQLFYFYKRRFQRILPNGNDVNGVVEMDAGDYQVPLPKEELIYR